jgi:hypothetical protein
MDERTANRLRSNAELSEFVDAITPAVSASDPEAFWACEQALARLLRSPFLRLFVRNELRRIAEDPAYIPAPGLSPAEFAVAAGNDYSLTIQLLEPGVSLSKKLYSSTVNCLIGAPELPGTAGPTYAWYEQTAPLPNEVFDRSRVLTPTGIRTFPPGEVYRIRAGIDVSRLLPPQQTVILLFLGSRNVLPLRWEYDDKLRPLRAMAATPTASRFEFTARMLAEFGDRESLEPLGELAEHPDHFVRWAAVRAVMRIDFDAGLHLLHAAGEDRHPHVRRAATRALENLERQGRLASRQPRRAPA